jgi:hypothetical protein
LANESAVKISKNKINFIFDKYNSSNSLSLQLENLNGELDWRGVVKKIKGEFGVFIIKKKTKGKWGDLFAPGVDLEQEEDVTVSDIHEKAQGTLLSREQLSQKYDQELPEREILPNEVPSKREPNECGELTNELVNMMYDTKAQDAMSTSKKAMTRRKSKARSLVRNFKNIMNKYGNHSRKQLNKKERSHFESNKPFGDRTASDMESFLLNEHKISGNQTPQKLKNMTTNSKFGFRSSDQLETHCRSRSISRSRTGNIRVSDMKKSRRINGSCNGKSRDEAKTGLISEKKESNIRNSGLLDQKKHHMDEGFKVLTIEDIMNRENNSPGKRKLNGKNTNKPRLKLISEINSQPVLETINNPFKKQSREHASSMDPLPELTDAEMNRLQLKLQQHKVNFPSSKNIVTRKSIYHQQVSNNYLKHLNKSRKSIRSIDLLTNAYRRITQKRNDKGGVKKVDIDNSASLLEELNIEISTEMPIIQNSSVFPSSQSNNLPIKTNVNSKSHRNVRKNKTKQPLRANKSNPRYRHRLNKQLRNIENSLKPKSVPKKPLRSMSKPYQNKKKQGKGSSVVFTKPRAGNKKVNPKQRKISSKSAVHNRKKSQNKKPVHAKVHRGLTSQQELLNICKVSKEKKQEIFDTFASLNLDMGWVHKQCRHMDLDSGSGVQGFLEMQNRLIVKLATKLRKEKNSRYKVEQQCQSMMEKFSQKLI